MCFSSPSVPSPPPPPPPPAPPPEPDIKDNPEAQQAASDAKKRALLTQGRGSTLLTGSQGVQGEAETQKKTLLGQ